MSRDQELWGMALWVEKTHGSDGAQFIAETIARLRRRGEEDGVALWQDVARRFEQLSERTEIEN
ncbi:DUF6961 family protein [Sphingosinithalassobacter sp. LHW66-3]|uniref:DUF6961 family protein n=1 Tax=Sphingosinithalassobacter sp. LHW66-3 TaxID=3424718 RepID=UPI003D6AEA49